MPAWLENIAAIVILLVVVTIVIVRLPKIDLGYSDGFRRRRVWNWLPLGLTYAFLYMGRYNLKVSKFAFENLGDENGHALMGNDAFGWIFGIGTVVYGFSFLVNGPFHVLGTFEVFFEHQSVAGKGVNYIIIDGRQLFFTIRGFRKPRAIAGQAYKPKILPADLLFDYLA